MRLAGLRQPASRERDKRMTGQDLLKALADTGTGASKLAAGAAILKADPSATALQFYNAMAAAGIAEGTLAKARSIMGDEAPPAPEAALPPFPVRAPVGGVSIGGRSFAAGQRIPGALLEKATLAEQRALHLDNEVALRPVDESKSAKSK